MKILIGNTVFVFNVVQNDATTQSQSDFDEYQIEFKFRKFQTSSSSSSSQSPDFEQQRSLRCNRDNQSSVTMKSFVKNLLREFEVPENTCNDMVSHFDFFVNRLSRRSCNRSGAISVVMSLDVQEISSRQAEGVVRRRREREREEREREREEVVVEMEVAASSYPAKKSVVENLREVVVVVSEGDEEKECSVCLEKFGKEGKGIELPCLHVYHKDCIQRWLGRNHFCPFCRFKLPC